MKYPKIETLYNRDKKTLKVLTSQLRLPEFGLINKWSITEKINGTNVRVFLSSDGTVRFGGRTDNAQMPTFLLSKLQDMFTAEKMISIFTDDRDGEINAAILFGEGYGAGVEKGSGEYRDDPSFRLFDVRVGNWWLSWDNIEDVARKLSIETVPVLATVGGTDGSWLPSCKAELEDIADHSEVARIESYKTVKPEGIVARTDPLLLRRNGQRVMWKLKFKDF